MSITAHYTEPFIIKRHFPYVNFRWLVIGSAFPDFFVFDRIFMFLIDIRMHRDYLFGYFHTLFLPLLLSILLALLLSRKAGISFLIGSWLHVLHDLFDEIGVKLFWPFIDKKYAVGIWPWKDGSLVTDLWNYYTTPASGFFELVIFIWALFAVKNAHEKGGLNKIAGFWNSSGWR